MKESTWKECIQTGSSINISPDRAKAKSLIDTATGRNQYLKENSVKESNANYLFEGYYSSALEMLHALIILSGYRVANHICIGYYIRDVLKKEELFRVFDDCRFKRNSLIYYGRKMDFEIAKQAIKRCQSLINQISKLYLGSPYYIIIRGPLGVGKTTIAKKLAEVLAEKAVSIDYVLKKHGLDVIDQKMDCIPLKNFIEGNEIILPEIKEKLKLGKIVILDGCFYYKEQIEHIKSNLKEKCFVFTLKAPVEICIERDSKRKKSYGKDAAIQVHKLVSKFDYEISINTENATIKEIVDEIVSSLPN